MFARFVSISKIKRRRRRRWREATTIERKMVQCLHNLFHSKHTTRRIHCVSSSSSYLFCVNWEREENTKCNLRLYLFTFVAGVDCWLFAVLNGKNIFSIFLSLHTSKTNRKTEKLTKWEWFRWRLMLFTSLRSKRNSSRWRFVQHFSFGHKTRGFNYFRLSQSQQ